MSYTEKFTSLVNTKQDYYQGQYFSSANGLDENITVKDHYDGYIDNGLLFGLILAAYVADSTYRYVIADTLIQSRGGNDNFYVPQFYTGYYRFGQISIDTGGSGYNTFTWNNASAFHVTQNSTTKVYENNMVVSRNGNDLNITLTRPNVDSPTWGNIVIQKWFDKSADYKIEKFTFNSAEGYKFIRNVNLLEAMVENKKITDISVTDTFTDNAKFVAGKIKTADIESNTIQAGAAKIIQIDKSVKGEIKFWAAEVEGSYTKAQHILLKNTAGGILISQIETKYASGDKTDGSVSFNDLNNDLRPYGSSGNVSKNISFSGINREFIDSSLNVFLSTTPKIITEKTKIAYIDTDAISFTLAGAYMPVGGISGSKVINIDRSVRGELKFWAVVVDGIYTKAVQVLLKDTPSGISVSELQAKYAEGDKTNGSFDFNSQGNSMQVVDNASGGGYGVSKISLVTSDKIMSGISINEFLSTSDKFLAVNTKAANIRADELELTIGGGYITPSNGIVSSNNILFDRSVSGQLKFWSVVNDGIYTKAVQVLVKDTAGGVLVSELQAKYAIGDKTDGSYDFNTLGNWQNLATKSNPYTGYGIKNITFFSPDLDRFTNYIYGTRNNDTLVGTYNIDLMWGSDGNDTYILNDADDSVGEYSTFYGGFDTVKTSFTHTLEANVENLYLIGTASVNATGNSEENNIYGNSGNNILDGGGGSDIMSGGLGNDTFIVDNNYVAVIEYNNEGIDTVKASIGYRLNENFENLTLTGSNSNYATGNSLNNIIIGNSGNNTINGRDGNDTLTGGLGADKFVFDTAYGPIKSNSLGDNVDFVTDFSVAQGDKIVLDRKIYTALAGVTDITDYFAKEFPKNTKNCIIYNSSNGLLAYDADGNGNYSQTSLIAMFTNTPNNIDASTFIII